MKAAISGQIMIMGATQSLHDLQKLLTVLVEVVVWQVWMGRETRRMT